jgi:DUF438 domain-containing protein
MGLNFRQCHPVDSLDRVVIIVDEMKSGARDEATFWLDMAVTPGGPKHKILIEFFALRDETGKYIGCLEFARDVQEIMELKGEKRLL